MSNILAHRYELQSWFVNTFILTLAVHVVTSSGCNRSIPESPATLTTTAAPKTPVLDQINSTASWHTDRTGLVDDTEQDGWTTESFSRAATSQLKQLAHLITDAGEHSPEALPPLFAEDFQCHWLRPSSLQTAYTSPGIKIRQRSGSLDDHDQTTPDSLPTLLASIRSPFLDEHPSHVKLKLIQVDRQQDVVATTVLVEVGGMTKIGSLQQNATWNCTWIDPDQPRLQSIQVTDYAEATLESKSKTLFRECTPSIIVDPVVYESQFRLGTSTWVEQIESRLGANFMGDYGLAVADVNGDGLEDLYVCQAGGLPNRLLTQNPDGTVTDRSATSGVDLLDLSRGALFVDLDNDGDQDLILGTITSLLIFENDGLGIFQIRADLTNVPRTYSLAAADYDQDGRVDIYACVYASSDNLESANPIPYHDANNSAPNHLLRNLGEWQFSDVTEATGLDVNNRRWSYAASWEDYDNDGDMDLYVANDFGRNCLYENEHGNFRDVAADAGVQDIASGMSVAWSDYNRDGWMDVYVGNMFSAAGGRVTYQRRFKEASADGTKDKLRRLARGNSLFENQGDGTFKDVSVASGVTMGRWAWSSQFADINNDGWDDLLIANGHITGTDSGDL